MSTSRELAEGLRRALGECHCRWRAFRASPLDHLADRRDGGINAEGGAAIDDHTGAFRGEGGERSLCTNASGGGGDEGEFDCRVSRFIMVLND